MTAIRDRRFQCQGKVKHATREAARETRARMAERAGRENLTAILTPYECPHCNCFHLGTARDWQRRLRQFNRRVEKQRRKQLVTSLTEVAS